MQLLTMPRAPQPSSMFKTVKPTAPLPSARPTFRFAVRPAVTAATVATLAAQPADPVLPRDVASRFGRRIRELRQARSMTQVEVAVHFGIDRTFISDVERGRKSVCLPTMEVFALGFGLSLSELLRGI